MPLRERNRLETWALIHDKASGLALDEGLAKTTVEAIADAAGISKRTFFNYFATKEDAIMGTQPPRSRMRPWQRFMQTATVISLAARSG